jgi:FkbM family methyltransferase
LLPYWVGALRLGWHARQRLTGAAPVRLAAGDRVMRMVAEGQIAQAVWKGGFEVEEREFVLRRARPGMRVLNVGANAGLYCLLLSAAVGAAGEIHAFEPSGENYQRLLANLALNGIVNVRAEKLALAAQPGSLALCADPEHPRLDGHYACQPLSGAPPSGWIETVACDTLDHYWRQAGGGQMRAVHLMVMDVEGGELEVLRGALELLAASPEIVLMLECTQKIAEVGEFLQAAGLCLARWDRQRQRLVPAAAARGTLYACRPSDPFLIAPATAGRRTPAQEQSA